MRITGISASDFPPFRHLDLSFPEPIRSSKTSERLGEVQLLTGINGTGKSRLLACLAAAVGGPEALKRKIIPKGSGNVFVSNNKHKLLLIGKGEIQGTTFETVGSGSIWAVAYSGAAYVSDHNLPPLAAVALPGKPELLDFNKKGGYDKRAAQLVSNIKIKAVMAAMRVSGQNPVSIAAASRPARLMALIEQSLTEITGRPLTFRVEEREKDQNGVMVDWGNASMPYSLLPDGLRSIIGWLVDAAVMLDHMMPEGPEPLAHPSVILLDEIECHLHPAWQRKLLPIAQRVFRNAQIFVATHSPFVICSLNEGWIHKLRMDEAGNVTAQDPLPAKPGDSYISVMEDIMGVDEWFDPETHRLLEEFRTEREKALRGDAKAVESVREKAAVLRARGPEVADIMGRELRQLERLLALPLAS